MSVKREKIIDVPPPRVYLNTLNILIGGNYLNLFGELLLASLNVEFSNSFNAEVLTPQTYSRGSLM